MFAEFLPESGILQVRPHLEWTGIYFITVTLTSDAGNQVEKDFWIWIAFVNFAFFNVEIIPPIDDADPVGRRNIT